MNEHLFSVFDPAFSEQIKSNTYVLRDKDIMHRIVHVLRMKTGQKLILFDRMQHAVVKVKAISKKTIEAEVCEIQGNVALAPHVTVYLPLLKKDALSQATYSAVELGASEIQYVITEKSRQSLIRSELDRLERVAIAAAEQSKQFTVPHLYEPIFLSETLDNLSQQRIYFDPDGILVRDCMDTILSQKTDGGIAVLLGPEGDMTDAEKKMISDAGWSLCSLTPTVLRSVQAVAVSLGIIRSYFR